MLRSEEGRHFVRYLLDAAGLYDATPGLDPQALAYRAGKRDLALMLVGIMNEVDPRLFVQLVQDGANDVARANMQATKGDPDDDLD